MKRLAYSLNTDGFEKAYGERGAIEKTREIGFDAVDWSLMYKWETPRPIFSGSDGEITAHYKDIDRMLKDNGLAVAQTHAMFDFPYADDRLDWVVEEIRKELLASSVIGAPYMVVHPYHFPYDRGGVAAAHEKNLRVYEAVTPFIREYGTKIAVENVFGVPYEKPEHLLELLSMLPSDCFGVCLDFGHANFAGESVGDFIRALGNRLAVTHIHDNCGKADEHLMPFSGSVDWVDAANALNETGYSGALNLELLLQGRFGKYDATLMEQVTATALTALKVFDKMRG